MSSVSDLVVASANVRNGRLFIQNRQSFDRQVAQFRESWQLEVTVKRRRATRSPEANRYYWGVVIELIAEHTGYTSEEVHDVLKTMFIPKRLAFQDGNGEVKGELVIGGSTRRMNKLEFGDYMESIRRWAAESLDVVIPDPNETL